MSQLDDRLDALAAVEAFARRDHEALGVILDNCDTREVARLLADLAARLAGNRLSQETAHQRGWAISRWGYPDQDQDA